MRFAAPGTKLRLVILEDLDPLKIDFVGATFNIPPSFFGAHLQGAGYGPVEPELTNSWNKFRLRKTQFSLTWLRPVLPFHMQMTAKIRNSLINISEEPSWISCILPDCDQRHKVRTPQNILRKSINLSAKPDGNDLGDFPVGWEERFTIWKSSAGDCNLSESETPYRSPCA
jgi:hypothetical protein